MITRSVASYGSVSPIDAGSEALFLACRALCGLCSSSTLFNGSSNWRSWTTSSFAEPSLALLPSFPFSRLPRPRTDLLLPTLLPPFDCFDVRDWRDGCRARFTLPWLFRLVSSRAFGLLRNVADYAMLFTDDAFLVERSAF